METDRNSVDRSTVANLRPYLLRSLLATVTDLGISPERLCIGLGFGPDDLANPSCRLSFRQAAMVIRRALQMTPGRPLGLMVGESESIASIGLTGFAMLTCRTLRDAAVFGIQMQDSAGTILRLKWSRSPNTSIITATSRFAAPAIQPFLVEEAFASWLGLTRSLIGHGFRPLRIELAYPEPTYAAEYHRCFGCPVRFSQTANSFIVDNQWAEKKVATFDPHTHREVLELLRLGLSRERETDELFESVERLVHADIASIPTLDEIAPKLNMSGRTLRRKLMDRGLSFQMLVDNVRKNQAIDLLSNGVLSIDEVAEQVGFSNAHNFRRAFRRWTGTSPTDLRKTLALPQPAPQGLA